MEASDSAAALPCGVAVSSQLKIRGSSSTSTDPLPSSATMSPTETSPSDPACATGGSLTGLIFMLTVAVLLSAWPSLALYENESLPL